MSTEQSISRRDFLKSSTLAAAGVTLAGGLSIARTAHAAGSDQIKVALIGCGGRGTGAAHDCLSVRGQPEDRGRGRRLRGPRQTAGRAC